MAIAAYGTLLKLGDGATPESFTTIFQVVDITGPSMKMDTVETTNQDSAGWGELIPTIFRAGDVKFDVNYTPTNATHNATTGMIASMKNRTLRNFKLVYPDVGGTTWPFTGYVTGFEVKESVKDKLTASVTISITGAVTLV
jgi:hypothetical protein